MIIDAHAHIIVDSMTATPTRTEPWRIEVGSESGQARPVLGGREVATVIHEFFDAERMAEESAALGVEHLLLSPWVRLLPYELELAEARHVCRLQNEALAALVAARPKLFSAIGAVALQDPATAAADLLEARASGLVGVELATTMRGRYLGDDLFEPFWKAAEESGALVFIHPTKHPVPVSVFDEYHLGNTVGNPIETAVTAAHIVMSGVLERHPDLKILLAHGGGAIWSVRGRMRRGYSVVPAGRGRLSEPPDASLARLYHDTITHDQVLLARLIEDAGADHVLLGSDRPFDMGLADPVADVRSLHLSAADEAAVLGGNAARLLELKGTS
jgi:aminocarboxymuconate-semialdehyde decarboxylase